jgi:hypothetical protein
MKSNANNFQQQPQRQSAQEIIAANVQALIEQLEQGMSDTLTAYLNAMSRFHRYSFGNILSIARHRPDATHVAGFHTWRELGRYVMKGQKGIPIQAPMMGAKRQRDEQPAEQDGKPTPRLIGFRTVYVFDVSQTDGDELPEPAKVTGEVGECRELLFSFLGRQDIEIEYNEAIAPAQGVSYGGRIALLPGQAPAEELATLIHEAGHELLHRGDRRAATTRTVRELEAEAVAFVVGQAVGLQMGTTSADYIKLYNGNPEMLAESLEAIQSASAVILAAILPHNQPEESQTLAAAD